MRRKKQSCKFIRKEHSRQRIATEKLMRRNKVGVPPRAEFQMPEEVGSESKSQLQSHSWEGEGGRLVAPEAVLAQRELSRGSLGT